MSRQKFLTVLDKTHTFAQVMAVFFVCDAWAFVLLRMLFRAILSELHNYSVTYSAAAMRGIQ